MRVSTLSSLGTSLGLSALLMAGCGGGGGFSPPGTGALGSTPAPSGGGRSTPTGGNTPAPSGGGTSTPTGGNTPAPSGGGTSTPTGGGTSTPTGGGTSTPTGGGTSTPTGTSSPSSGGSSTPAPSATVGTLSLSPTMLAPLGITNPATATTTASQPGYAGSFVPSLVCPVALPAGALAATANGSVITVFENPNLIPLLGANVFCTLTVAGGGGQTATAMVLLATTLLPSATPTPAGTTAPGASPGALTVAPGLFLPIGLANNGSATGTISQVDYSGPFTASIACPIDLPTGALTTNITGSTITVTEQSTLLTGVLGANLLCTLTVRGGANMTGTANVLLGANVGA